MRTEFDEAVFRGRDCRFPDWMREASENACAHDEIILNSTGISSLTFAGRCAQSEHFSDNIHVYGTPVEENRRLAAGVTLRARTLEYFAASFGVTRDEILSRLYVCDPNDAAAFEQRCALTMGNPTDGFTFAAKSSWMNSTKPRKNRTTDLPLAYGIRNSRLNRVLQDLAVKTGVQLHDVSAPDMNTLRSYTTGENPLFVNGTPFPVKDADVVAPTDTPTRCVVAIQMPFTTPRLEARGVLSPKSAFITWVYRDRGLDMGVFYPFCDDLSPEATFYGIFYRIAPGPKGLDKDGELSILEQTLIGVADALGMEPVDPEETAGRAAVPISPWSGTVNRHEGVLDVSRLAGAGAPIITGDGMTRAAVGGFFGAESVLAGRDPVIEIGKALRHYRQINWELSLLLDTIPGIGAQAIRYFPGAVVFRNAQTYYRDMWASAY